MRKYLVKWAGYDMGSCSWEPEESLTSCGYVNTYHLRRELRISAVGAVGAASVGRAPDA